jgi:hypothetical protein
MDYGNCKNHRGQMAIANTVNAIAGGRIALKSNVRHSVNQQRRMQQTWIRSLGRADELAECDEASSGSKWVWQFHESNALGR